MTDTINATAGLSFNLTEIHGHVTGVTYGDGVVNAFAQAAYHDAPEGTAWRMAHLKLNAKIADRAYGTEYAVESWEWITKGEFDRVVDMRAIRQSLGWRD